MYMFLWQRFLCKSSCSAAVSVVWHVFGTFFKFLWWKLSKKNVYPRALIFAVLCFRAASFSFCACVCVCVCVKRSFSKCYSLGKDWDALFFFQMLILHSTLLFFTLLLTAWPHPSTVTATTHTHTRTHTLITSNVVLSVFSPVDHLVVVIEEVLCNSSIGSIIETKNVKLLVIWLLCNTPFSSALFFDQGILIQVRKCVHDLVYWYIHFPPQNCV